jgi:hypothetical protein
MAERKTRREFYAAGTTITERTIKPDGTKTERFYATTKANGGEPSGRELDDAFQIAQVLSNHSGLQDRLHDLDVRLSEAVLALRAAQEHLINIGGGLPSAITIALEAVIDSVTNPGTRTTALGKAISDYEEAREEGDPSPTEIVQHLMKASDLGK